MATIISVIKVIAILALGWIIGVTMVAINTSANKIRELEHENTKLRAVIIGEKLSINTLRNSILNVNAIQDYNAREMAFEDLVQHVNTSIRDGLIEEQKRMENEFKS